MLINSDLLFIFAVSSTDQDIPSVFLDDLKSVVMVKSF